jgi:hypothetical protein
MGKMSQTEGKRPLERPGHRWENNIKMDCREVGCENVDLIHVAQGRVQFQVVLNTVMTLQVLYKAGNLLAR